MLCVKRTLDARAAKLAKLWSGMITAYAMPSVAWAPGIMPLWCLNTATAMNLPLMITWSLLGWPSARSSMLVFFHTVLDLQLMT